RHTRFSRDWSSDVCSSDLSGKIKNGFPDGIWKGKFSKSKFTFIEKYENGKLISGVSKDSLNIEYPYTIVDQRPSPKKGMSSFYKIGRASCRERDKITMFDV